MAIVTNAYPTYNSTGKTLKEQLSETISNISPFDTPFMSSIKKEKAKSTKVEWLKDTLATPSTSNAQLEGDTYAATATADVTRLSNMAQISAKSFAITSTQESVDNAGMSTYSAYELAKNSKALKTDMETSLFNNGAQVAGGVGTARSELSAASYGVGKGAFGYGNTGSVVSLKNLVSDSGVIAADVVMKIDLVWQAMEALLPVYRT